MNHADKKRGFTIIELMLAMTFVSVLLIAIAMTVIQMGKIYNRGLMLKEVNESARLLASDLQRNIASSNPFSIDPDVGDLYEDVVVESYYLPMKSGTKEYGGRLCLGRYSYIWNYGKYINDSTIIKLNSYSDEPGKIINFVKIYDPSAIYCTTSSNKQIMYHTTNDEEPIELIGSGDYNLSIHDFKILSLDTDGDTKTGQKIYNITFVIGTNDQIAIDYQLGVDAKCKTPSEIGDDHTYCSINKFSIVARSGSSVESNW